MNTRTATQCKFDDLREENAGVGGTWYEIRCPGCACDIPAHSRQRMFAPNFQWSSFYAPAPEIREYIESIVRRYSVDRFIKCSHKVVDARWDEKRAKWHGEQNHEFLVSR
ncbi:hypothetical protein F5884DRAFT_317531 [Xylogone sp. PMI_703]|nr:hypothetical protein F5884DRAFT_317531 [Xylogone sp. PMI_703]